MNTTISDCLDSLLRNRNGLEFEARAASRLATILASGTPTAFALVRTMGLQPDVDQIVDRCV